jgi:hypothetical protein
MAQRTQVILEDDIDGGKASETVAFGLDGRMYEIDVSAKNAAKLRKALAAYVASARTAGRVPRQSGFSRSVASTGSGNAAVIREWALSQGYEVSARGRIPGDVVAAFEASR